jgi:hypothetical protein
MPTNPIIQLMTLQRRACVQALLASALPGVPLCVRAQRVGAEVINETWRDAARSRAIPVKIRWPDATKFTGLRPLVLFSHGLGGTVDGGAIWGEAWAAAGFVVAHLQHAGSDLAAVRGATSSFADQRALRTVAGPDQLAARLRDVMFVLDEVGRRHAQGHGHWAHVRPAQIGMSGHSFGAHTTLGVAGQRYPGFDGVNEPRLAAFIALSPTAPVGAEAPRAFERLTRPVLSVTGTLDSDVAGTGATPERRMAVYGALPKGAGAGPKAHLVLKDADHMTFAGQTGRAVAILPRESAARDLQPAHHSLVARITTDWWLATLADDAAARARLQNPTGLRAGDRWEQG